MLPQIPIINIKDRENRQEIKSKTYYLDFETNRVKGYINGLDSVKQAVFKILQTERYEFLIYDWSYGSQLKRLIGKSRDFVQNDIQKEISESLLTDSRILTVSNFNFSDQNDRMLVTFDVRSTEGDFVAELIQ